MSCGAPSTSTSLDEREAFQKAKRAQENLIQEAIKSKLVTVSDISVPPVKIGIFGDLKAGKSSVGNILLRRAVLPTSYPACTSRPTIVSAVPQGQSEQPCHYTLIRQDGTPEKKNDWEKGKPLPISAVLNLALDKPQSSTKTKEE